MNERGYIILRDLPSPQVQFDLSIFSLQAGERGFRGVPAGTHYVAVMDGEEMYGFWCYLSPGEVLVKRFDPEIGTFEDAAPALVDDTRRRLEAGTTDVPLLDYEAEASTEKDRALWSQLTRHIGWEDFPPELNAE